MKEVETAGIGRGGDKTQGSLQGEEAGKLIMLCECVFVCYNTHVTPLL